MRKSPERLFSPCGTEEATWLYSVTPSTLAMASGCTASARQGLGLIRSSSAYLSLFSLFDLRNLIKSDVVRYAAKAYVLFGEDEWWRVWEEAYGAVMRHIRAPDGFWVCPFLPPLVFPVHHLTLVAVPRRQHEQRNARLGQRRLPLSVLPGRTDPHRRPRISHQRARRFCVPVETLLGAPGALRHQPAAGGPTRSASSFFPPASPFADSFFLQATPFAQNSSSQICTFTRFAPLSVVTVVATPLTSGSQATKDEFYLEIAEQVLHDINNRTRVPCGLAAILGKQDFFTPTTQ